MLAYYVVRTKGCYKMKRRLWALTIFYLVSLPVLAAESVMGLEKNLQTASGKEKVKIMNKLAFNYAPKSSKKCIQYGKQALALSRQLKDTKGEAGALLSLSRCYREVAKYKEALEYSRNALKIFNKLGDKKSAAACLLSSGIVYMRTGNFDHSLEDLSNSLEISKKIGDKNNMATTLTNIGLVYFHASNYPNALKYLQKSLEMNKELQFDRGIADSLSNIGVVYMNIGNYKEALDHYLEALDIRERIGLKKDIAGSLNNIGLIYKSMGDFNKSIEFYLRSLKLKEEIGDTLGVGNSLNNIGVAYFYLKKPRRSLEYFSKVLDIYETIGDKKGIGDALSNIGDCYYQLADFQKSLEYETRALAIAEENSFDLLKVVSLFGVGDSYLKLRKPDKAFPYFKRCLDMAEKLKLSGHISDTYYSLSNLYESKADYKNALEYYKRYSKLKDEVMIEKNQKQLKALQIKFETAEKDKEIQLLKRNSELQEIKLSKEKLTRNVFLVGFILAAIIVALLVKKFLYLFSFWKKQRFIGQYRLLEKIGSGGMGTIYKAHSIRDKSKKIAIKILREELFGEESNRRRFEREAKIIDQLNHPNIIKIIERGQQKQHLFIVMELLEGQPLDARIREQGKIQVKKCLHISLQIAGALIKIHKENIFHRDLKPANIMVIQKDNHPDFVKLLDFGLAKMKFETTLTESGIVIGTINYTPPEQLSGAQFSAAGDIYSLGAIMYEMVTGKKTFHGESSTDIMRQILGTSPIQPNMFTPGIPSELNRLIMQMLAKLPPQRPNLDTVVEKLDEIRLDISRENV